MQQEFDGGAAYEAPPPAFVRVLLKFSPHAPIAPPGEPCQPAPVREGEITPVSQSLLRALDQSEGPHLRYLGDDTPPPRGDLRAATALAQRHQWLVERMIARTASHWPRQIDLQWLRDHAQTALLHAAACVDRAEDLPEAGAAAILERLRTLLAGTQWYREAMITRARPLCEAWRSAVLSGRQPTDRLLCTRLHLSAPELTERFSEVATVFAVEPAGLMPGGRELHEGIALVVGELPGEQQLVVSLYFEQGFTIAEIARVLEALPVRAQELLGRAAVAVAGEAVLADYPYRGAGIPPARHSLLPSSPLI